MLHDCNVPETKSLETCFWKIKSLLHESSHNINIFYFAAKRLFSYILC